MDCYRLLPLLTEVCTKMEPNFPVLKWCNCDALPRASLMVQFTYLLPAHPRATWRNRGKFYLTIPERHARFLPAGSWRACGKVLDGSRAIEPRSLEARDIPHIQMPRPNLLLSFRRCFKVGTKEMMGHLHHRPIWGDFYAMFLYAL